MYKRQVDVDWQRGEVYVLGSPTKVYVYAFDGTYKQTLDTKANIRQGDMFNFSADKLILFKEKTNVGKEGEMIAYCPIMLLDKSGGNIDSLQYVKTWDASLSIVIEGNENMKAYLWCEVMLGQGGETYLNDIASDTIYRINKKTNGLFPILLRTPSVRDSEGGKYYLRLEGVTSRYYFLKCQISSLDMTDMVIKDDKSYVLSSILPTRYNKEETNTITNKYYEENAIVHLVGRWIMYNYTRSTGTRKVAGVLTGGKIYSGETEHHVVLYCGRPSLVSERE